MATAGDLCNDALGELGVLAAGEVATADEADHALQTLNRLINTWEAEKLNVYQQSRTTWTIVSGTGTYTVGSGGTVNRARPIYDLIDHVRFQDTSVSPTLEYPLESLTQDAWAYVPQKDLTSPLPTCWAWEDSFPLATLTLWPTPTSTTLEGVLYCGTAVPEYASLATAVSLPPGYRRFIVKALALELAPSYEKQPHPALVAQAEDAKLIVKRSNAQLMDMSVEQAALGSAVGGRFWWDIRTGP